jgi:hypothetical protein
MDSAKTDKVMLMGNGDYAAWKNYLEGYEIVTKEQFECCAPTN